MLWVREHVRVARDANLFRRAVLLPCEFALV